jgi:hypothetical protein
LARAEFMAVAAVDIAGRQSPFTARVDIDDD